MIGPAERRALELLLDRLATTHVSVSSVTDPARAWDVHVADSLCALDLAEVKTAGLIADLGSGGGFPGLPLALLLPQAQVEPIESVSRKCDFIADAAAAAGIENCRVVNARAEVWAGGEGRERYDLVTARAVGSLAELAELSSPLLRKGGVLVAWKGARDPDEERDLAAALPQVAMRLDRVQPVTPYRGSRNRHLHLLVKSGPTPVQLPRRPGIAHKRPLGSERTL